MDMLTNEEALLSVSRSAAFESHDSSSATPIGEELIRDTSDNLVAIQEVDYPGYYSSLSPQVGTHGSYSSMHVLTIPPTCVLRNNERGLDARQATTVAHSSEPAHCP